MTTASLRNHVQQPTSVRQGQPTRRSGTSIHLRSCRSVRDDSGTQQHDVASPTDWSALHECKFGTHSASTRGLEWRGTHADERDTHGGHQTPPFWTGTFPFHFISTLTFRVEIFGNGNAISNAKNRQKVEIFGNFRFFLEFFWKCYNFTILSM